jgi:hypothetical protein
VKTCDDNGNRHKPGSTKLLSLAIAAKTHDGFSTPAVDFKDIRFCVACLAAESMCNSTKALAISAAQLPMAPVTVHAVSLLHSRGPSTTAPCIRRRRSRHGQQTWRLTPLPHRRLPHQSRNNCTTAEVTLHRRGFATSQCSPGLAPFRRRHVRRCCERNCLAEEEDVVEPATQHLALSTET